MTYLKGTGGGPYLPPPPPENEDEKLLADTIAISIQGLTSEFDSDGLAGKLLVDILLFNYSPMFFGFDTNINFATQIYSDYTNHIIYCRCIWCLIKFCGRYNK